MKRAKTLVDFLAAFSLMRASEQQQQRRRRQQRHFPTSFLPQHQHHHLSTSPSSSISKLRSALHRCRDSPLRNFFCRFSMSTWGSEALFDQTLLM